MSAKRTRTRKRRPQNGQAEQAQKKKNYNPGGLDGGWYKPLTDSGIERIHAASLDVLEQIGIEVQPSECRDIFEAAGARVDAANNRVYIPRSMVEDAIADAPSEVTLCGRDPKDDIVLGGKKVYMGTGGAAVKVLDIDTGIARESTLKDVALLAKLCDALENIHFFLRPVVARDISDDLLDLNTFYASLVNTTKHVTGNSFTIQTVHDIVEMASMMMGGNDKLRERPIISYTSCWTVSPLRYAEETVEVLTEIVRQDIPVFISSAPQAGATGPAALAGTLVQINAEELSGIVYTQLVRKGARVILGYVPSVSDLRSGNFVGGAPEFAMMHAAAAQLGQFYSLPVYNSSGLSDSKIPDIQAGYEKGLTGLAAALAGSNYIHHSAGLLESLLTAAYEQFVIDDDINGSIMRMVRGIEVTDESLSIDVIREVCGQGGAGHYLGEQQSIDLMHSEFYYPHTADRRTRQDWVNDGRKTMREVAIDKARHILRTHQPQRIDPAIDAAIRERFEIVLSPDLAGLT